MSDKCLKCTDYHSCLQHSSCINHEKRLRVKDCSQCKELFTKADQGDRAGTKNLISWLRLIKTTRQQRGKSPSEAWDLWQDQNEAVLYTPLLDRLGLRKTQSRDGSTEGTNPVTRADDDNRSDESNQESILQLLQSMNSQFHKFEAKLDSLEKKHDQLEQNVSRRNRHSAPNSTFITEEEEEEVVPLDQDDLFLDSEDDYIPDGQGSPSFSSRKASTPIPLETSKGISSGPSTLRETYLLPEDAMVIGMSTIEWKDHIFTEEDIIIVQKPGRNEPISFKVKTSARMSEQLIDLIKASNDMPSSPPSQAQTFSNAFKLLDSKLTHETGWHDPNAKESSVKVDKFTMSEDIELLSRDILSLRRQQTKPKGGKLELLNESNYARYFQGPKLTNDHNSEGLHLGNKLGYLRSADIEKEFSLRQRAWSACKVAETLEVAQSALSLIPQMSIVHSLQDRDEKITNISNFIGYSKQIAHQLALSLSREALTHKASMRYDTVAKVQPPIIKEKLLKSSLLQDSLFGKEEFSSADSMASQAVHFQGQHQSYRPQTKRPIAKPYDPSVRKRSKPQLPIAHSKRAGSRHEPGAGQIISSKSERVQGSRNPYALSNTNPKPSVPLTAHTQNFRPSKGFTATGQLHRNPYKKSNI